MAKRSKLAEFRFKIDAYTPDTIPMARLAKYLAALAEFLGEESMVHFVALEKGSTSVVQKIQKEAIPKVEARITLVKRGDESSDAMKTFRHLNHLLREDNGAACLFRGKKGKLLPFPGINAVSPTDYGAFWQDGTLDGVPIRVGGKRLTVPITIEQEERVFVCLAKRALAKRIAAEHLFTSTLRMFGRGRWYRDYKGSWILEKFIIKDFIALKRTSLSQVVEALRAVEASEWSTSDNPWKELHDIRHGSNSGE
ncbi:MAG: hypothetical protein JNN16_11085 [Nitrospira sp.]|nr:hypothetical protein [Nitrospira sp.]